MLTDQGANIDAAAMVNQLIDSTVPIVTPILEQEREPLQSTDLDVGAFQSTLSATGSSNSTCLSDSHTQTAVTYDLESLRSPRACDEPLSLDEALIAVKPSLLAFGGLQRLILIVSNETERSQLEPQVRDAHDGALTVAVIPGSSPKLIHEAQQVELKNILSRLTILNGGNAQVTGRLSSRTDISW